MTTPAQHTAQWTITGKTLYCNGDHVAEFGKYVPAGHKEHLVHACNSYPDLLEMCKVALQYLLDNPPKGNIRDSDHFHALNRHANEVVKPLRAAIARAEQSSPREGKE